MSGLPPLGLQAELQYADGTTTRWDSDARAASDRPTGISFRTQRYTGFADAQLTLNRRIDREYPDLGLLDGITLVGDDGSVAYDGRVGTLPRSLQQHPQVTVQAQGWMSHAKDEPFVELFVDRNLGGWGAPTAGRAQAAQTAGRTLDFSTATHLDETLMAVVMESSSLNGKASGPELNAAAEAWYAPPPGCGISAIYYDLTSFDKGEAGAMSPSFWTANVRLAWDALGTVNSGSANLLGTAKGYWATPPEQGANYGWLDLQNTNHATGAGAWNAHWRNLAVYGNHGLTRRGEDPGGFYVSDMIANIASRFAPKLDTSGIQETTFPVPHASFPSDTLPYDAFQTLNTYHRWEMAVYEDRKLLYYPIDLTDYDWEIRLSDPGTQSTLQGDDVSNLTNGVIVRYTDLNTGRETRLTPGTTSQLKDESPNNPANINGDKLYTTLALSVPTTEEGAIQIGRAYLAEFNEAQATGSLTVTGHVRDRAGHWQPAWKVRAGDRLIISDLPNDSVRVVGETSWDHDSKQLSIAVDASFKRLDAILARLTNAVEASNVSLPGGI